MKVADYIARYLEERGVQHVFEVSGGYIMHMLDAIQRRGAPRIVSLHHEQSAAFAADAVGRITGVPGVAMGTAGPGATNLLTGVASAHFDSSPAVFLTGHVHSRDRKGGRAIRQLGFQETDVVTMAGPITKGAWEVPAPDDVPALLERAFEVATSGRPGPVLIDVPLDVQYADIHVPEAAHGSPGRDGPPAEGPSHDVALWSELLGQLERAARPLIWVGGGIRAAQARGLLRRFVERVRVPVVSSLLAVDALPWGDPFRVGFIGAYGNRWANLAVGESDFILVLGARLDIRQTGSETDAFKGDRTIFQVDCEAAEMNNRVKGCRAVEADLKEFLTGALELTGARRFEDRGEWLARIRELRRRHPDTEEAKRPSGIDPNVLMHQLSRTSEKAAAYVVDVGQHQMWGAQSLEPRADQSFLTSGGLGAMGFALPAAIGTALLVAPRPVVVVAGDGGFQLNIQELETVVRNRLPLKLVIVDNGCHGMTRQFQESFFGERYQSSLWGYSAPDFARVATAYGIEASSVEDEDEVEAALEWLWRDPAAPSLLQVKVNTYTNLYPKIAFGRPITEMEPEARPRPDWSPPHDETPDRRAAARPGRRAVPSPKEDSVAAAPSEGP